LIIKLKILNMKNNKILNLNLRHLFTVSLLVKNCKYFKYREE
jgi:hypothetical protein